jgi:hypothetical protein
VIRPKIPELSLIVQTRSLSRFGTGQSPAESVQTFVFKPTSNCSRFFFFFFFFFFHFEFGTLQRLTLCTKHGGNEITITKW